MANPRNGDKVKYINKPDPYSTGYNQGSRGKCVSDPYQIQEWTFIDVAFGSSYKSHPINVDNLEVE